MRDCLVSDNEPVPCSRPPASENAFLWGLVGEGKWLAPSSHVWEEATQQPTNAHILVRVRHFIES
jgi:hypothetical protein